MSERFVLHPASPQMRLIDEIVDRLRHGAVMLYPTDTVYAIGCDINHKAGHERIRRIRKLSEDKPLTFVTSSLSDISEYAHISDTAYHIMRHLVPGPYTFLLPASKLVPKLVMNPRRKTTGIRVPSNAICQMMIRELGNPLISMSARLPEYEQAETLDDLIEQFDNLVDIIIDDEEVYRSPYTDMISTMIDLTGEVPTIVREGLGMELAEKYL